MASRQKIVKIGNSYGITFPASFMRKSGWKQGDEVLVEENGTEKVLLVKPKSFKKVNLTPEFFSWLEDISKEYEEAIKTLANR